MIIYTLKNKIFYQSLVGSVVIDEFGREDHSLILHNCDRKKAETT
jgi:hypothetical protein